MQLKCIRTLQIRYICSHLCSPGGILPSLCFRRCHSTHPGRCWGPGSRWSSSWILLGCENMHMRSDSLTPVHAELHVFYRLIGSLCTPCCVHKWMPRPLLDLCQCFVSTDTSRWLPPSHCRLHMAPGVAAWHRTADSHVPGPAFLLDVGME